MNKFIQIRYSEFEKLVDHKTANHVIHKNIHQFCLE
jgi:hypothetical protein